VHFDRHQAVEGDEIERGRLPLRDRLTTTRIVSWSWRRRKGRGPSGWDSRQKLDRAAAEGNTGCCRRSVTHPPFIQFSSGERIALLRLDVEFAWKPYTGSWIGGANRTRAGSAREEAGRCWSLLHCIGVRTPLRSPE